MLKLVVSTFEEKKHKNILTLGHFGWSMKHLSYLQECPVTFQNNSSQNTYKKHYATPCIFWLIDTF